MDFERFLEEAERELLARGQASQPAHPSEEILWAYVGGGLSGRARVRVGAHLGSCAECAERAEVLRGQLTRLEGLLEPHLSVPETAVPLRRSRWELLRRRLGELWAGWLKPRGLARHALAYAAGSMLLFGINALLNELFAPPPSPLGSPAPPSWWAPYAVGAWGALLVIHMLLWLRFWRRRR